MDSTASRILTVETCALHAWPAMDVQDVDGWLLRYNDGVTRRANSVWPNGAARRLPLDKKLSSVEGFYQARGEPSRFQICVVTQPSHLDAVLERRGYIADAHTLVQSAPIESVLSRTAAHATLHDVITRDALSDEWFAAYCQSEDVDSFAAPPRRGILERIAMPTAYAAVFDEGQPASVGLGVTEGDWLGIFSMATSPAFRRHGAASALLRTLALWGRRMGAQDVYLQVMHHNQPARSVYAHAGFSTLYEYHYRTLHHEIT